MAAIRDTGQYKCHEPQEMSTPFYTFRHLLPHAGGHVTGHCGRSISGRNEILLSLPTGVLSLSLAALLPYFCSPFFALHPNYILDALKRQAASSSDFEITRAITS